MDCLAAYPGPDLFDLHYETIGAIDRRLPARERWAQYVLGMRARVAVYPRWRLRQHWLLNPPEEFAGVVPPMPPHYAA